MLQKSMEIIHSLSIVGISYDIHHIITLGIIMTIWHADRTFGREKWLLNRKKFEVNVYHAASE